MSAVEYRFLEPLDVLFLRGNKLFGDPGSHGESLVPPWPSVAAGALRSRMLADDRTDISDFGRGEVAHPTLGTPAHPGPFTLTAFHLARRFTDGRVEPLFALPADLVVSLSGEGAPSVSVLRPTSLPTQAGLACSSRLPMLPVLAEATRSKPAGGFWLTGEGWRKYLDGNLPDADDDLIGSSTLWAIDPRVGVGLDADRRRAADGRLFSVQAVAMTKREHGRDGQYDVGFLVGVQGAQPPGAGMLRLGGDGRAAAIRPVTDGLPEAPDYGAIANAGRCRLILTSPGIFENGWLPPGASETDDGRWMFDLHGVRGQLISAVVPRAEVVSGWDLARWQPKPALRVAPAGSVYWLDALQASPEALRTLADTGLWFDNDDDASRRAEGFNRVAIGAWSGS